jgi:diacylglycerol kinase family enzyme
VKQETLVILNPASAGGATGRCAHSLRERLEARFGALDFETTRGPRDATRIATDACRSGVERLLIAGGDGTTSEVAAGLLGCPPESRPALGLLPLGSGLDLARSLSLPRDLESALDVIEAGALRRVDAGEIEYSDDQGTICHGYFVNESSAGLSGETVRLVGASSKRLGPRLGFLVGAVGAILGHRPVALAVEIDGARVYEGLVSMVIAANGAYFGRGGHLGHSRVSRHRARKLVLIPKAAGAPVDVDGESVGTLPLRAEILPAALRIFAPTRASR